MDIVGINNNQPSVNLTRGTGNDANCELPTIDALARGLERDLMSSLLKIPSPKSHRALFKISIIPVDHGHMVATVLPGDQCRSIDEHPFLCMLFGLEPE